MTRKVLANARPFDSRKGRIGPVSTIVIENDLIASIERGTPRVDDAAERYDAGGRIVLPGLIDAHVHVTASNTDIAATLDQPTSLLAAESGMLMRAMLRRGFTTVRDAGGADLGLKLAQQRGLFEGPRLFVAGFPLSQTGGHGDLRPRSNRQLNLFCMCAGIGLMGTICDGVGEVRRAAREQIRTGADHIKIMAGGGVGSPADPLEGTQFSMEELRAIVEEAEAAGAYALAHAYSPKAVTRAVEAGVRSVEHGNLIDKATVRAMKKAGTFYVPTLSTYAASADIGARTGWSAEMLAKLDRVKDRGLDAIRLAHDEGVPIVFGTDLLGEVQPRQSGEFLLRAPALSALEILRSATWNAAQLMRLEGRAGQIAQGCWADLLVVDGDPTRDVAVLAHPDRSIRMLLQGGRVVIDRMAEAREPAARTAR